MSRKIDHNVVYIIVGMSVVRTKSKCPPKAANTLYERFLTQEVVRSSVFLIIIPP